MHSLTRSRTERHTNTHNFINKV
ncbi:rCG54769 [Rattus norvegicus]|uniref:RCG54769 n=1 Tax=Rattus norvegicus TaxID=10116 RepID=A6II87_RAT|nr:rCG54769 [Rattus norvegicus]